MSGKTHAQFDGLYKISEVFGLVLEFNEPLAQFHTVPPLMQHDHFFRDYAPIATRK